MTRPSALAVALDQRLKRWRRREERGEGALWHGINAIRNGLGDKVQVRQELLRLVETGRAERFECGSGVYWRALPADRIDIH